MNRRSAGGNPANVHSPLPDVATASRDCAQASKATSATAANGIPTARGVEAKGMSSVLNAALAATSAASPQATPAPDLRPPPARYAAASQAKANVPTAPSARSTAA